MPDLSTDDGLRSALRDVAAWGDPGRVPELDESAPIQLRAEPPRGSHPWVRPLMGAAAALVLVVVAVLVTRSPDDEPSRPATPAASADDLVGKDWSIDVVTAGGERREIDPTYDAVLRFDGEGGFSGTTCNHFGGDVAISSTEMAWGDEVASTLMGCSGDLGQVEASVFSMFTGTAEWRLTDGTLRIEGKDVTFELTELPPGFPTELVQLAVSDPAGEAQWQFGYVEATDAEVADGAYRYFLTWEGRSAPGTGYGNAGMAVDPELSYLETMWLDDVDGGMFVFGTLPSGTDAVRFEADDGTAAELTAYVLPDGSLVYGQVVPPNTGEVVALDAGSNEIGRGRTVPAT